MVELSWSKQEKLIARRAFDDAYKTEGKELITKVKKMTEMANNPDDIWQIHDFLTKKRKEINEKYDYRYSVLILVFGRLLREGWIALDDLDGLDEDKIVKIKYVANYQ